MTYKNGFLGGLGIGLLIWLITAGILVFAPNPDMVKNLGIVIVVIFTAISIILGIAYAMTGHASFLGTTGDGFFYGFTTVFDVLYFVIPFLQGKMPVHLASIIFILP